MLMTHRSVQSLFHLILTVSIFVQHFPVGKAEDESRKIKLSGSESDIKLSLMAGVELIDLSPQLEEWEFFFQIKARTRCYWRCMTATEVGLCLFLFLVAYNNAGCNALS